MKKIFLILSLIIMTRTVNAETIYGEYYKVDKLNNEPIDEIKIESYKMYNTYKIEYEDLGYLEKNNEYIKDENDYVYNEIITNKYTESDEYIEINVNTTNEKKRTIKFDNITNLKIYEIEVYYQDKKIDYNLINVNDLEIKNICDNDLTTYYIHNNISYINFKFDEALYLKDLKFIIYTKKYNNTNFLINMDNKPEVILNNSIDRKHIISFNVGTNNIGEVNYFYIENVKLYRYYKELKIKENIYKTSGDNLLLDDYKTINGYYKRDKLVLKDDLIITSSDIDVNSFIEYSSNNVITNHNIDYTKNGIYKCEFILKDIKVIKDIVVNIKNYEPINNNIVESINLNENVNKNIKINNKTKVKSKELNNTTTKKISKVTTTNVVKKKVKNKETSNKKIKIIIFIILIVIEIFFLIKRKRDNVEYI